MKIIAKVVFNFYLLFSISFATAQQKAKFSLNGIVRSSTNNEVIKTATVKLLPKLSKDMLTDLNGAFSCTLIAGFYKIEISHIGFIRKIISVKLLSDTLLDISLSSQTKDLEAVIVKTNDNKAKVLTAQVGVETIDRKTALLMPAILGEVDIIKVLQLKPGVKNSGEGTSGISVRGGGTDQNLFLLDGTVVYNPNHLFGFFSTFNIDAIKDVQLYKAGFPAEFSGRLSSVIDVNTLKGTDSVFSWGGGVGLIASRLNIQGNLLNKNKNGKKLNYNIVGRRTYADVFTSLINESKKNDSAFNKIPNYFFYDMNTRVDYFLSEKNQFFGSFYYGRDLFKLDSDVFGTTFGWGNTVASMHWKHKFSKVFQLQSALHFSDYNYALKSNFDRFNFKVKSGVKEYSLTNKFIYTGLKNHQLKFGIDFFSNQFSISTFNITSTQADENLANGEIINTSEAGAYIADDYDISKKLKLNFGGRVTYFNNKYSYAGFEPRVSARYLFTDGLSLKASYSRMQQYKHLVASSGASLPTDIWYPSTKKIKPELSDQVSLGFTWNLKDKLLITNEVYYKWMRQLVDFKPGASLLVNQSLENEFVFGKGTSYGNELSIEKTYGKLKGWIGYTIAWSTRQFDAINDGKSFFPRYDRRHEISVVASYPLSKRLILSGSWTYYTGNAVTLPTGRIIGLDVPGAGFNNNIFDIFPVYPERGNYRMPNYHRLDLAIVWKLRPRRGNSDITFSAYNAYSRLNAYFISFQRKRNPNGNANIPGGYSPTAITLFPIIPSITYNFKF
jgi:outer membrane receptor protein involved in Fe transport